MTRWQILVAWVLTAALVALVVALIAASVQASGNPDTQAAELLALGASVVGIGAALYGVTTHRPRDRDS